MYIREPDDFASDFEVAKGCFVGKSELLDQWEEKIHQEFGNDLYIVRADDHFLELLNPKVNKGNGLKELTEKPSEETPENTPNQSQDQQNNQITGTEKPVGNNNANNDSQTSSTTVVKTNDQTALLPIVCMLGVSIVGIVLLKRRNNY